MPTITKNGRSYDGGDVKINMLGIFDIYADGIDYSTKQEHQNNYGLSRKPRSWSKGKIEYEGKITLMMEDMVAIQTALPSGQSILDIDPFRIIVFYEPNIDGQSIEQPVVDTIFCKFKSTGRKVGNEMGLKNEYELHVLDIKENVKF